MMLPKDYKVNWALFAGILANIIIHNADKHTESEVALAREIKQRSISHELSRIIQTVQR